VPRPVKPPIPAGLWNPILGLRASWKQFQEPTEQELADLTSFGVTGTKLFKRAGLSVEQGGSNFDLGLLANSA
jgi:hypothetical protein